MNIECMILKLEHPNRGLLLVHEDIYIPVHWISQELVPYYLGQLAIAISHIRASRDIVKVFQACEC